MAESETQIRETALREELSMMASSQEIEVTRRSVERFNQDIPPHFETRRLPLLAVAEIFARNGDIRAVACLGLLASEEGNPPEAVAVTVLRGLRVRNEILMRQSLKPTDQRDELRRRIEVFEGIALHRPPTGRIPS
jgi:hypothetical protein